MADLNFRGSIPASKSILNRALIAQSYFPELRVRGDSECDDVLYMKRSLEAVHDGEENLHLEAGEGGTTFRFLALRAARLPGRHELRAHPRLLRRPQKEVLGLLEQLGVRAQLDADGMKMQSRGWQKPDSPVEVDCSESSQYASALVLNAWSLDFDLRVKLRGKKVSESYLELTLETLRSLGMEIHRSGDHLEIPQGQSILSEEFVAEPDISSIFTMAAAGALNGRIEVQNFPATSRQPDLVFLDIFKKMQIDFDRQGTALRVHKTDFFHGVDWNLNASPDLFPVLAVLCAFADGDSKLHGAPQLAHKESNRIEQVSRLLTCFSIPHQPLHDGMLIHGGQARLSEAAFSFDPDQDHRMVMAATLMKMKMKAEKFRILTPEVVNKSWPEFFRMMGAQP